MANYFGTDGIRGIYGKTITPSFAFKFGCALAQFCKNKKVLIGRDTRPSGQLLALSVANGLCMCGINVVDIGIAPTPVISLLTENLGCDYGIVISASHNPPEHNGIKVFDRDGYKITEKEENNIESALSLFTPAQHDRIGKYEYKPSLTRLYQHKLLSLIDKKQALKIVIDCANGATYKLAKAIFKKACNDPIFINSTNCGTKINENCGALHPEVLAEHVKSNNADFGFCFDGDGDRMLACNKDGEILDGDDILCMLSQNMSICKNSIVGTVMTNKGFENFLNKHHISLLRADVGDKYVSQMMREKKVSLGGEPSGHIIIDGYSKTGDGLLVAALLLQRLDSAKSLCYKKFPQININIEVDDKYRLLNSDALAKEILTIQSEFKNKGRVLVRASGTEQKIRVMCEHISHNKAVSAANRLEKIINTLLKKQ